MCGINGFNFENKALISSMNKRISHRGPDSRGFFSNPNISFGQVRLSIVDLTDAGHQPMFYSKKFGASNEKFNSKNIENSSLSITYNGEVYNYVEIKKELEKLGYTFSSNSDTEVILASYLQWGEKCVNKFNGMWAFVIYDKKKDILFCSRDRLGVKPFYYYLKKGNFIFSSELKGILETSQTQKVSDGLEIVSKKNFSKKNLKLNSKNNINKDAVDFYFSLGFVPAPLTIFNDVFKLEASKNLIFDLKKKKIIKNYFYYEIPDFKPIKNWNKLVKEGKELLKDSVKIRMRSDVPVGAFLSGGLDSSAVVGYMKNFKKIEKLNTFSIGFKEKSYDETPYINIVKKYFHTKHHHHFFTKKNFQNLIKEFSQVYDEPFWDYSGFPTIKISSIAKKRVSVVFSGDGGDEIFGGYNSHLAGSRIEFLKKISKIFRVYFIKIPFKKNLNGFISLYALKEAIKLSLEKSENFYARGFNEDKYLPEIFKKWSIKNLSYSLKKGNNNLSEALRIYDLNYNTLGDNFLVKVDRASMKYGVEIRSPFLDYRFIEFAQKIPTKYKVSPIKTKILMREIISDILPNSIINRGKQGFNPPISLWINNDKNILILEKNLDLLYIKKIISFDLYSFYKNIVFKGDNKLNSEYKIKLFLFFNWYEEWIKY